ADARAGEQAMQVDLADIEIGMEAWRARRRAVFEIAADLAMRDGDTHRVDPQRAVLEREAESDVLEGQPCRRLDPRRVERDVGVESQQLADGHVQIRDDAALVARV